MNELTQRYEVEVVFDGQPPTRRVATASGVSGVEVHGSTVRCTVRGSFQPFLEALRGYEVVRLVSTPTTGRPKD